MSERSSFSGKLGFVLAAAGAAVGLGNIWRFPYLAAKHGGGIFLLVYILLALTFGFTMLVAESSIGRMTGKSPVGAFSSLGKSKLLKLGGWLNAIIPLLIVSYYCVIGGWVLKYLVSYISGQAKLVSQDGYFSSFITNGGECLLYFVLFTLLTVTVIFKGIEKGIERVSRFMMPSLIALSIVVMIYSITRPGAMEGVKYLLIPNFSNFSIMTIVAAMGQMFYSLSIAMGILITYGSYMKKDTSIEKASENVEVFDTFIAIMAALMIIPAVFAFSGGDPEKLQAGPSLMFITLPKVFESMGFTTIAGIIFFVLVLFAALTSSIALTESVVSTFSDSLSWSRRKSCVITAIITLLLGAFSALSYGPLDGVRILGLQILDFVDFLTNSVMMPISALFISLVVSLVIGVKKVEEEVELGGAPFRRKRIFSFTISYLCPIFSLIILISSILSTFGLIKM